MRHIKVPSSSGLGYWPLTPETRVRNPLGLPKESYPPRLHTPHDSQRLPGLWLQCSQLEIVHDLADSYKSIEVVHKSLNSYGK
jgi:hypothetical protein